MKILKDMVSYLHPVLIEARAGTVTPYLEVVNFKGKYRLNSHTVNYSFGGLHTIFEQLFQAVSIGQMKFSNILILGMGAGSVISLLRKKYGVDCAITAVEKDEVVIELARRYFNIDDYRSLKIINEDAYKYTCTSTEKYDLIISDLFIEDSVPEIFASNEYLANLKRISNERCCVIYNKMTQQVAHREEFVELSASFMQAFPGSRIYKLSVNGSRNSLLYYNTIPVPVKELNVPAKLKQMETAMVPFLKPSY